MMIDMLEVRTHLIAMLAIIAENRVALKIERHSPDDKAIIAARKIVIASRPADILLEAKKHEDEMLESGQ
jgi:hypothetical protein